MNGNKDKFNPEMLEYMYNYAPELLKNLGYAHLFNPNATEQELIESKDLNWIKAFNEKSLEFSKHQLYQAENITSIVCNYPALLLRKKSAQYPDGRTSYRFKRELRKKVTIIGKTMFGSKPTACETDLPETDDREEERKNEK